MILSGLRVFDIRDPAQPREIAYFNAPVTPRILPPGGVNPPPSNWAMSSPSFVPERNEIWYSDGLSGFYAVRLTDAATEVANQGSAPRRCLARRSPIGPRNIGRVRLGLTRARLRALPLQPLRTTRHSYRYCVKGSTGTRNRRVLPSRPRRARRPPPPAATGTAACARARRRGWLGAPTRGAADSRAGSTGRTPTASA